MLSVSIFLDRRIAWSVSFVTVSLATTIRGSRNSWTDPSADSSKSRSLTQTVRRCALLRRPRRSSDTSRSLPAAASHATHHGTDQCFSLTSIETQSATLAHFGCTIDYTRKKKTITTMWARSLLQSHEEDHLEIRNTLVTLESNTWSIRRAISKSAFLVIRSPFRAESLESHRCQSDVSSTMPSSVEGQSGEETTPFFSISSSSFFSSFLVSWFHWRTRVANPFVRSRPDDLKKRERDPS